MHAPIVHLDRTVTFQVAAPNAQTVALSGGHIPPTLGLAGDAKIPFTRTAEGAWTLTIGPLPADLYDYAVEIDGVRTIDPANLRVKVGALPAASQLFVAGPETDYFAVQDVPHGVVHRHYYSSKVCGGSRELYIYTPPAAAHAELPVLYLLHGIGEVARSWSTLGAANLIADNLLAAGRMQPMIIVMPHGHCDEDYSNDDWAARLQTNLALFDRELFEHVIPLVEAAYPCRRDRQGRALAGLSMGAMQTESVGYQHLDHFSALGLFSGTGFNMPFVNYEQMLPPPAELNKLDDIFLGCGEQDDWFIDRFRGVHALFNERRVRHRYQIIPGAHTWSVWRWLLAHAWLPHLFQPKRG